MNFTIEQQEFINDTIKEAIQKERGRLADILLAAISGAEHVDLEVIEISKRIRSGWGDPLDPRP